MKNHRLRQISKVSSTKHRDSACKVKVRIRLALLLKLEELAEEKVKRESEEKDFKTRTSLQQRQVGNFSSVDSLSFSLTFSVQSDYGLIA